MVQLKKKCSKSLYAAKSISKDLNVKMNMFRHILGSQFLIKIFSIHLLSFLFLITFLLAWELDNEKILLNTCSPFCCAFQMLQEGGPLPGPKAGLLSNTQK